VRLRPVIVFALAVSACGEHRLPPLRFPQVEQGAEAVHGGGERYRDHRMCFGASTSADELIRCMGTVRWQFVDHGLVYPEPECWEARERGELERLVPHCFVRAPEHP
jgi:hypothetical protein